MKKQISTIHQHDHNSSIQFQTPDRAPKSLQLPLSELSANLEDSLDIPSFRVAVYLSIPKIRSQISVSRIRKDRLFPGDLTVKRQKKSPASEKETGDRKTATTYSPTCAVPSA